jgi:LmbE family N-acetylglucosaminyl deacetylase
MTMIRTKYSPNPLDILDGKQKLKGKQTVLIVCAHPDDETLFGGCIFSRFKDIHLLYLTDGAPQDMKEAMDSGFNSREDYSITRKIELFRALRMAGIPPDKINFMEITDQETPYYLTDIVFKVADYILQLSPDIIFTHPYEGGHPDHDSAAFSVHAAVRMLQRKNLPVPEIYEFSSYYNNKGSMSVYSFLNEDEGEIRTAELTDEEAYLKTKMLEHFITQSNVIKNFPIEHEKYRKALNYKFLAPPHEGPVYYELMDWGITGEKWRALAKESIENLGLTGLL